MNPKFETSRAAPRTMDARAEARAHRLGRLRDKLLLPALAALVVIGLLAAAWFVSSDQRRGPGVAQLSEKELADMKAAIDEHEQNFASLVQRKSRIAEEDLAELEQAVAGQERYTEAAGNRNADVNRLAALRVRLHLYRAERLREQSSRLESDANLLIEQADRARALRQPYEALNEQAIGLLRQAVEAEKEIRQKWVLSNLEEPGRLARLDTRLRRLEADPVWEKGRRLEKDAEAAVAAGNYTAAEKALSEALVIEQDYVVRFRDVRATEYDREQKLQVKLDTVRSLAVKGRVDELVRKAGACEAAREWEQAAGHWGQASEQTLDLINRFPLSLHAKRSQAEAYAAAQTRALSMPEVERFRVGMSEIRDLLRAGDTSQAATQASSLAASVELLCQRFPTALDAADPDRLQLAAIRDRSSTLSLIREALVSQLLPIPGGNGRRLLRTEVPQALYVAVMGDNPSARREPTRPVESLTYEDAERFCTRLGWLTGLKVRLPDVQDYKEAVGDPARKASSDEAWTIDTADGQVHPVGTAKPNPAGFHDLCGNVAEWVRTDDNLNTAMVIGGDAQSALDITLPTTRADRRDASRLRGLRVTVEP